MGYTTAYIKLLNAIKNGGKPVFNDNELKTLYYNSVSVSGSWATIISQAMTKGAIILLVECEGTNNSAGANVEFRIELNGTNIPLRACVCPAYASNNPTRLEQYLHVEKGQTLYVQVNTSTASWVTAVVYYIEIEE